MKGKIAIVDYGVGNTNSVWNAVSRLGYKAIVTESKQQIMNSDAIILPGVGAFSEAMFNLKSFGLDELLDKQVKMYGKPILGICIGMQVMAEWSEEDGVHAGLGWIPGRVRRLSAESVTIPHVGWNEIRIKNGRNFLTGVDFIDSFDYFWDHSYFFDCEEEFQIATAEYGNKFTAVVAQENIVGVQFHPEKSQDNGLRLFRSFFDFYGIK